MIKLVDFLSRSMSVLIFSALLAISWMYQAELNSILGPATSPMLNRLIQLLLAGVISLLLGGLLNWLLSRLLWRLERRQAIRQSPPIR